MTKKNIPFWQLSGDAQVALTQFDQRFAAAFASAEVEQWATENGLVLPAETVKSTLPIPLFASSFKPLIGEQEWNRLSEKSISLTPEEWFGGVEELVRVVESKDFTGWGFQPEEYGEAAKHVPNSAAATVLQAGTTTVCVDGGYLFREQHPYNIANESGDDYDNAFYSVGTIDNDLLGTINERFRKIKDPSGTRPLGLRLTDLFAPPALEFKFRKLLEQAWQVQSLDSGTTFAQVDNLMRGKVKLHICDEFTSDTAFYPAALGKPGMYPWILTGKTSPTTKILDASSEFATLQRKVRWGAILTVGAAGGIPHCIARYDTAAA